MPTALVLTLRPQTKAAVALHLGRASHAAFLNILALRDAELARRLHDQDGMKPFAVSDLLGPRSRRDDRLVQPEQTYTLRWCGLTSEIEPQLHAWSTAPPESIDLDGTTFTVEQATIDPASHQLAGVEDWNSLVGLERVGRETPPDRFVLRFIGPATFRSNGRNVALPLPELVFGSLLERWNQFAPVALPVELRRYAAECLVFGRYRLQSYQLPLFGALQGGGETVFTGTCTYLATNHDRYYLHCCAALLRLAFWSGIGAKTSMGLGLSHWEYARMTRKSVSHTSEPA